MALFVSMRSSSASTGASPGVAPCWGTPGAAGSRSLHDTRGPEVSDSGHRARSALLALLATAALLAGCGQRGPLYLPDQPPPKKRFAPAAQDEGQLRQAAVAAALAFEAAGSAERPTRNRS
jgi:predicted small lipoprotein YifL